MTVFMVADVKEAAGSLAANKRRSLLALIGIVIGIGSVIALLTAGAIARDEAIKQFDTLGTDVLSVFETGQASKSRFRLNTSAAGGLARLPSILAASPYTLDSGEIFLDARQRRRVQSIGVTSAFAALHRPKLAAGRFVSSFDHLRPFAVIGSDIAGALRKSGVTPEAGLRLRMKDKVYTVIGVLESGQTGPRGARLEEALLIPLELAQRELGTQEVFSITLRMSPDIHYLAATAEIEDYFRRKAPGLTVRADSPVRLIEQREKQMRLFALLLGAVGGLSLLMGGFGVMNAMLASVTERRFEIGIRRALGARRWDIRRQFLVESALLCLLGGILGAGAGVGATWIICVVANWTWQFSAGAVALGVGTACAAGLFFGYYPATQAARLDPITALRNG